MCVRCLEGKEIEIHPCWTLTVRSYMAPLLLLFYWMSVTVSLDEAGRNCGLITHLIRLMRAYHLGILYFKLTVTGFRLMADRHAFWRSLVRMCYYDTSYLLFFTSNQHTRCTKTGLSELHMQPLPHFIKGTDFLLQQPTVLYKWRKVSPFTCPVVAQRVGRGIALLFHDRSTRTRWVVSVTPRPYFTPRKDPVPTVQEAGWAPGPVWTGGKSRPTGIQSPDHPARSQSLSWLSYPAHCVILIILKFYNFSKTQYRSSLKMVHQNM